MSTANIFSLVEEYLNICSRHQEIVRERELIIADFHYNTSIVLIEYLRQLPLSSLREQTNSSTNNTRTTRTPTPNPRQTPPQSRRVRETNSYDSILNRRRSIYSTPPSTTRNQPPNNTYRSTTTQPWSNYVRSGYNSATSSTSSTSSVFDYPPNTTTTRNRYSTFPSNPTTQVPSSTTQPITPPTMRTSTSETQTPTPSTRQTSTSETQTPASTTTTDEHDQTPQPPVNLSEADTASDTSNDIQMDYSLTFPPRETVNNDSLHINTDILAHNNLDEETLPSQVLVHSPPPNTEINNSDTTRNTINTINTRNTIMTRPVVNTYTSNNDLGYASNRNSDLGYVSNRNSDLGITIADTGLGRRTTTNVRTFISSFESPVRIRPSRSQINNATSLVRLSDVTTDISGNTAQTRCPIDLIDFTQDDFIMKIDHCGHLFRESNLRIHFRNNTRCPLCRFDIRDHNNV